MTGRTTVVFWTFRVMVGLGALMLLLGLWSAWTRWRSQLYESKLLLRFALLMGPSGLVAILAGWLTTEIGRQPWVVYGVMRTQDAVSNHSALALTTTLAVFVVMYFAVFGTGTSYMIKLIARGPQELGPDGVPTQAEGAHRRTLHGPVGRADEPSRKEDDCDGHDLPIIWAIIIAFAR
jgi:cytochrome d ubiquinol oxidase subunit I